MKRDWLLYLVVFSLALNVGTIGFLFYLRHQDRQAAERREEPPPGHMREVWGRLNLTPEQRRLLGTLAPDHRRRMRELRLELQAKRQDLLRLLQMEPLPDWPPVQVKVREISTLQGRLEEEVTRHLLTLQQHLNPEQRRVMAAFMEQRLAGVAGGGRRGKRLGPGKPGGGPECLPPSPPPESR